MINSADELLTLQKELLKSNDVLIETVKMLQAQSKQFVEDASALRLAGGQLATAAQHVVHHYDGIHRLALAISRWNQTIADEGGRGDQHKGEP